jgi:putative ABC transport system substrate-binding protein
MTRREFIALCGTAVAGSPFAARAQQPALPVIGYLGSESPDVFAGRLRAFLQGLSETGYVEGINVDIEYRWAENQYDRFPALLSDLVRSKVTVIAAVTGTPPALAARPRPHSSIVFVTAGDPVALGLVASLRQAAASRAATLTVELGPKQLSAARAGSTTVTLLEPASPCRTPIARLRAAAITCGFMSCIRAPSVTSMRSSHPCSDYDGALVMAVIHFQ